MAALKWIWQYVRVYRNQVVLVGVMVLLGSILNVLFPLLMGVVVDEIITKGRTNLLIPILGLMIGTTFVRTLIVYAYRILCEYISQKSIYQLRGEMYRKLHDLDFGYFNQNKVGDIMTKMTGDIDTIRHFIAYVTYVLIDNFMLFTLAIVMLLRINWRLTLLLLCLVPIIGFLAGKMAREVRPSFMQIRESFSRLNSIVQENISGNRVVKAFAKEDYEIEKFTKHNQDFKERNIASARIWAKYLPPLDSLASLLNVFVILVGGIFVINDQMTLGNLIVFNSYLWMLNMPMRMAGWLINDVQRCIASSEKIKEFLETTPKVQNEATSIEKELQGSIEFQHVDFYFEDDKETLVLQDISFKASPGQTVAILGATGAGKSTLVNLICRFYDASRGQVLIDGKDVRTWDIKTLRSRIATVMQDIFLFSDTVEGNIAFGEPNSNFDQIRDSALRADAHHFITKMEEGYDTIVGERGVGLSGGQKQRISLARALLKNPAILILDDTTSAVDMETEFKIQNELKKISQNKTTFIIAHRISSVKDADLILVLDKGKIIERGKHEELLERKNYYYEIYQQQIGEGEVS